MKNVDEAIRAYADMFGGFPAFLFMGASDEEIIKQKNCAPLTPAICGTALLMW